jgi:hypothetical protein
MVTTLLKIVNNIIEFIKNNPKFFLGVIFALLIILQFRQCGRIKELKHEIKVKEVEMKNESDRFINNIENLKDSVVYIQEDNVYVKSLLRVKEGELEFLDEELNRSKIKIQELAKKVEKGAEVKNIYVTKISSDITTNDVLTNVERDSLGNFSVGITDTNQIYSINTQSWFRLVPNNETLKLELVDKFGNGRSSLLNHRLNFSLTMSQIELEDGKTRVLVQPIDQKGEVIPNSILSIPFVNGAEFMDIEPKIVPQPTKPNNRRGFGVMVGPSYGLYNLNGTFQPTWGIGISVGYKIF